MAPKPYAFCSSDDLVSSPTVVWCWKSARSSGGTPKSSAITSDGTGKPKSRTMSAGRSVADHLAEKVVDQFLNLRPHRFATPEGEVAGDHPPQPMMLGIVGPREYHRRVVVGARWLDGGRNGFRGQARIDQRGSDVLVTAHHPGRLAVVHRPSQARLLPPFRELRRGMQRAVGGARDRHHRKGRLGCRPEVSEVVDITGVSH